jgi:hypothetical protein
MIQKFTFFAQFDKTPGLFETNWLLNNLIARHLKKKDIDSDKKREASPKKPKSAKKMRHPL